MLWTGERQAVARMATVRVSFHTRRLYRSQARDTQRVALVAHLSAASESGALEALEARALCIAPASFTRVWMTPWRLLLTFSFLPPLFKFLTSLMM